MNSSCSGWYSSLLSSLYHSSNALANNNNILEGEGVKTEEIRDEDEEESEVRPQHQGEIQEMGIVCRKLNKPGDRVDPPGGNWRQIGQSRGQLSN